jgi:hypothetical protein
MKDFMNSKKIMRRMIVMIVLLVVHPAPAQTATNQPSEAELMKTMMELAKPGENHQVFTNMVGKWSYEVKWWMNPMTPAVESTGTTICKSAMGGRYFISDHKSKMEMPGADGKMTNMEFQGMAIEGYDNVKKKYVSSWIDNMGTGIESSEGTYDPATKTLTYVGSYEPVAGMTTTIREKLTIIDADHHTMEMFANQGGTEVKTMEITYTRKN